MNWFIYIGGWWLISCFLEVGIRDYFLDYARMQESPKSWLLGRVIGVCFGFTLCWIWVCWRFIQ